MSEFSNRLVRHSVNRAYRIAVLLTLLVIFFFFILPAFYYFSYIRGEEFSPALFATRTFHYYRLPYFHNRIGGVTVDSVGGSPVLDPIISNHLTRSTSQLTDRWDITRIGELNRERFEADILTDILRESSNEWNLWTEENPTLAPIFWTAIQDLAIHESYFAMPELFEFAKTKPTVENLKLEIARISQQAALDLARESKALKKFKKARETAEWGLSYQPSSDLSSLLESLPETKN